jgi:hypothetical protein
MNVVVTSAEEEVFWVFQPTKPFEVRMSQTRLVTSLNFIHLPTLFKHSLQKDDYEVGREIGGGAYGRVFQCVRKSDHEKYANIQS